MTTASTVIASDGVTLAVHRYTEIDQGDRQAHQDRPGRAADRRRVQGRLRDAVHQSVDAPVVRAL
jgi:hypothetical protein